MKSKGTVYLVGAGPGDLGLLTLRAAELIARADVLVYDALVNLDLLRMAPKSVELIYAGKRSKDHAIPQEELNALLVAKAREGKTVVRLKGGDPYVFGRGGEEAEELAAAKIDFEVVPGISSSVAGPNYAGFLSPIALIVRVTRSSPAMRIRPRMNRALIGRRSPEFPVRRSCSWASSDSRRSPRNLLSTD